MKRSMKRLTGLILAAGLLLTLAPMGTVSAADTEYNLTGFASGNTGGGTVSETDTAKYKKVYTATDLVMRL
ncbi:hypothetical protein LJK87_35425 [Paenibacillus sp. P25]|nr:hypothetical protein LJK87_35425 [Paenibacillus sp. P25]